MPLTIFAKRLHHTSLTGFKIHLWSAPNNARNFSKKTLKYFTGIA